MSIATTQVIFDGYSTALLKFTNFSDGNPENSVLKVDVSTLFGSPSTVIIRRIDYDISGMQIAILWDATVPETCLFLSSGQFSFQFEQLAYGGLVNNAGAGKTGDVLISTLGEDTMDSYTIILELLKVY